MLNKNIVIKVTNRANSVVGYTIPDLGNLYRKFQPNETKEISVEELRKLSYVPGGKYIINNCLLIQNEEMVKELLGVVEPEYTYSEEDIKNLLLNGSLDALLDCLDFAPKGVIDLVKKLAVDLEINDISKRNAIYTKTGFNVTSAIDINRETSENVNEIKSQGRRVPIEDKESEGGNSRRTNPPKYKKV